MDTTYINQRVDKGDLPKKFRPPIERLDDLFLILFFVSVSLKIRLHPTIVALVDCHRPFSSAVAV